MALAKKTPSSMHNSSQVSRKIQYCPRAKKRGGDFRVQKGGKLFLLFHVAGLAVPHEFLLVCTVCIRLPTLSFPSPSHILLASRLLLGRRLVLEGGSCKIGWGRGRNYRPSGVGFATANVNFPHKAIGKTKLCFPPFFLWRWTPASYLKRHPPQ